MTAPQTHPSWCSPRSCTAYAAADLDRLVHRSRPRIVPTDDRLVIIVVHLFADPDGSNPYVEIGRYDRTEMTAGAWYDSPPMRGGELMLFSLRQAIEVRAVVGSMIRAARTGGTR